MLVTRLLSANSRPHREFALLFHVTVDGSSTPPMTIRILQNETETSAYALRADVTWSEIVTFTNTDALPSHARRHHDLFQVGGVAVSALLRVPLGAFPFDQDSPGFKRWEAWSRLLDAVLYVSTQAAEALATDECTGEVVTLSSEDDADPDQETP